MPKFQYSAKINPQKITQGEIEADSEQDAVAKLNRMGYFPISVKNTDALSLDKQSVGKPKKIPQKDLALFTRQLATLIESGVNILNSLKIIADQNPNKYLRLILADIAVQIKDGKSLSQSLSSHPELFSGLYSAMIHAGEASGNLNETLKRLASFMEKEEELKNSVISALTYPLFVLFVGIATVVVLLTFVIPRLITMFDDMGQMLPLPTKILISVSDFMRNYWWLIIAVLFVLVFIIKRVRSSAQGRIVIDGIKLNSPVISELTLKTEIGRLMRILSLLLSSGVPIISALDTSLSLVQNEVVKSEIAVFKDEITKGASFSACLKKSRLFPKFVSNIVTVGEETGTLEKSLLRIADDYDRDIDRYLKSLTRLLEPVIILAIGLIVGFIVLSMLLPIFQINMIVR